MGSRWRSPFVDRLRLLSVVALVVAFVLIPWPATGSVTYSATNPRLDSVSPLGTPNVTFGDDGNAVALASSSPTPVRIDLVRTEYSFNLSSTFEVLSQTGYIGENWQQISATSSVPSNATNFSLNFSASLNATVDLANVSLTTTTTPLQLVYSANFSKSLQNWTLGGTAQYGSFGDPAYGAIRARGTVPTPGWAVSPVLPMVPGTSGVRVSGLVHIGGSSGALRIRLQFFSANGSSITYGTNWPAWANYSRLPEPLQFRIWTANLPYAVQLSFLANGTAGGTLWLQVLNGSTPIYGTPLANYSVGQSARIQFHELIGHGFGWTIVVASGPALSWASSELQEMAALRQLEDFPYVTVSVAGQDPPGLRGSASLSNASFTFTGSAPYTALGSPTQMGLAGIAWTIAIALLLVPEWFPLARRILARIRSTLFASPAPTGMRKWLQRNFTLLGAGAASLGLYAFLATYFGGHPYDAWVQKVWVYASQLGGLRELYVRPIFVGDAVIRGGTPWSTTGFGYEPVAAYLYDVISRLIGPLGTYANAVAMNAAQGPSSEIKWVLSAFSVFAAVLLYYGVRKDSGSSRLALAAFALVALGPAIVFDSAVWGETDSVLYLLFVLFAVVATWKPTYALAIAVVAAAFKQTGLILALPSVLLVLAPGLGWTERFRRLTVGAVTAFVIILPLLAAGLLPSLILTPYVGQFYHVSQVGVLTAPVSPETYTVWTLVTPGTGPSRLFTPSSTPLVLGLSFAVLGEVCLACSWILMGWVLRPAARRGSLVFWLATTTAGAVTFTALLTGTGSRYYTLAIPGLAGILALWWPTASIRLRRLAIFLYVGVTAISFWTMYGLLTVFLGSGQVGIRGLGYSVNPLSSFIARWYLNNTVITVGSVVAVGLVVGCAVLVWILAHPPYHSANGPSAT